MCSISLCLNNATCENIGTTNYMCDCTIDFTGENCEIEIDQCALDQRVCNNGTCMVFSLVIVSMDSLVRFVKRILMIVRVLVPVVKMECA